MKGRSRIKIELTITDKVIELIGWLSLLAIWVLAITSYSNLPDTIPIHYDGTGQIDRFGNKINILTLPLIATILFVGITIANRFPHIFNYPIKITEENTFRQYSNITRMNRYLKLIFVIIFGFIAYNTIESTNSLGFWFLPLTMGLLFTSLIYFVLKTVRTK
ncbi:MAG: DUF1648 domain-containing protein [Verrucomicrobia bacterium]|nr:DUF1648 domain-containing protein [Prolixibacteraceae bacterium]